MSKAWQCDRCGSFYPETSGETPESSAGLRLQGRRQIAGTDKVSVLHDLCPACAQHYIDFVKEWKP